MGQSSHRRDKEQLTEVLVFSERVKIRFQNPKTKG